jgi:uncharacterized protein YlzI (FlbEa/FlbD family)
MWQTHSVIEVTNLAKQKIWVNQDLVKMIETVPDTILCFLDGSRLPICETPPQVQEKIITFLRSINDINLKD